MPNPVSSYLLRPRRKLSIACHDISGAKGEEIGPCEDCPVAGTCTDDQPGPPCGATKPTG